MRRFLIALVLLLLIVLAAPRAQAVDAAEEFSAELETERLVDALPDDAAELLDGIGLAESRDPDAGVAKLIQNIGGKLGGIVQASLKSAASLLVIALLCGMIRAVYDGKGAEYVTLAAVLAAAAVSVFDLHAFMGLGQTVLDELDTFSKVLLPTLTAAAAAGGAVTSAAAKYAATALFMDVLLTVSRNLVMPMIYAYTAAGIASAALGGEGLSGAARLIKWAVTTFLTVLMLAFVAYLTLTGAISGTTDAVTAKAAKTAISTVLPVVGGIVSDAADTILAGASILRNTIGVFGLLAAAAMCAVPFLRLGVQYLLYKAAAGLTGALADSRLSLLIGTVGSAFGMVTGLVGASAVMVFVSVISVIRVVSG